MHRIKFIPLIALAPLLLSGCISFGSSKKVAAEIGGVFKTVDKGDTWVLKSQIPTVSGKPESIASLDASSFISDPSDQKMLYYGSANNGLYYSSNNAEYWLPVPSLQKIPITSIAVDYTDKCTLYVATANRLYKSEDCTRTWEQVFVHDDPKVQIVHTVIDYYQSAILYIATAKGEILKSSDAGVSWKLIANLNAVIRMMRLSESDSRIMLIGTESGLFRTKDSGETFELLKDQLKEFKDSKKASALISVKGNPGLFYYTSATSIFKTNDNGDIWTELKLVTPEKGLSINSVAVNPQNPQEIYYITNTTFYRSIDGGENWTTVKLPTGKAGGKLLIDADNPSVIYFTTKPVKKKTGI